MGEPAQERGRSPFGLSRRTPVFPCPHSPVARDPDYPRSCGKRGDNGRLSLQFSAGDEEGWVRR
jgi:hypothetical protein